MGRRGEGDWQAGGGGGLSHGRSQGMQIRGKIRGNSGKGIRRH